MLMEERLGPIASKNPAVKDLLTDVLHAEVDDAEAAQPDEEPAPGLTVAAEPTRRSEPAT